MSALGPFVLDAPIGRGGLCQVWRGHHHIQGTPVAIKISAPDKQEGGREGISDAFLRSFQHEVRAVAQLSHPAIVRVFDTGQLSEPLADGTGKILEVGSPYLVMELAEGSLEPLCGALTWPQVMRVLMALLDALAHAHARGVIHRDLKPANVLLVGPEMFVKLADFGIAAALSHSPQATPQQEPGGVQGTPAYMAPEQFLGDWRACGPWTDLYALGCVGYSLLLGHPPFAHVRAPLELMAAHLRYAPAPLPKSLGIPDKVHDWFARLLAKAPKDRFLRAADAAWSLRECCKIEPSLFPSGATISTESFVPAQEHAQAAHILVGSTPPALSVFQTLFDSTLALPPQASATAGVPVDTVLNEGRGDTAKMPSFAPGSLAQSQPSDMPSWAASWERVGQETGDALLRGVGLGLYGLREIPLVARTHECAHLWATLGWVWQQHKTCCVVLRGAAGTGKSRLARWLCERAHELGMATPLQCVHYPQPGQADGLSDMLGHHMLCTGLEGTALRDAIDRHCEMFGEIDAAMCSALAELIHPSSPDERRQQSEPVRLSSPQERFAVLLQYLESLCLKRPVVLWLDDVQWGLDSLAFVMQVMSQVGELQLPLLLVLTVQEEALIERPMSARFIEQLMSLARVTSLEIDPLPVAARSILVRQHLGLSGALADEVEQRTAGNPMFAVQLVEDWVLRGLLQPGEEGFVLCKDAEVLLPDGLFQVWERRIARLLSVWTEDTGILLEMAAALGSEVDNREWEAVCALADLPCPHKLVTEMVRQGLASFLDGASPPGWVFAHHVFRESIERRARDAGRWASHHALCAVALPHHTTPEQGIRVGRHYIQAEQPEAALEHLFGSASALLLHGEATRVKAILTLCQQAIDAANLPPHDRRRGVLCLLFCRTENQLGLYEIAAEWANNAIKEANAHQWSGIRCQALYELTRSSWKQGNVQHTWSLLEDALQEAQQEQELLLLGNIQLELGHLATLLGQLDKAEAFLLEAQITYVAIDDDLGKGKSFRHLGEAARQKGDLQQAMWYAIEAKRCFALHGGRDEMAQALNLEGEILRYQRDFVSAEQSYRTALQLIYLTGNAISHIYQINLALTLTQRQLYDQALPLLKDALHHYESQEHIVYTAIVKILSLPCLANSQQWQQWDTHLLEGTNVLEPAGIADVDLAEMMQSAGAMALKDGHTLRANRAFSHALRQWETLQRHEEANNLRALLHSTQAEQTP